MTEAQTVQYRRFLDAGFDPADARIMIDRGAWLGTTEMSAEVVADIERYRTERDKERADASAHAGDARAT